MGNQATAFANQYAADLIAASSSTGDVNAAAFGFQATFVRVINDRAAAVFLNFNSTTPSTGGARTCAGETVEVRGVPISGLSVASTTTSTGTLVRVLALGA